MVQSLICIKPENDRNLEIYLNRLKLNSKIQLDNLKALFTFNAEYLHHVTSYHCFLTQKQT